MSDPVWYLGAGGKVVGPMTIERVHERLATGVPRRTKAWREGMDGWAPLGEVDELVPDRPTGETAPGLGGAEPATETPADLAPEVAGAQRNGAVDLDTIPPGNGKREAGGSGIEPGADTGSADGAVRRERTGKRVRSGPKAAQIARTPVALVRGGRPDRPTLAARLRALLAEPLPLTYAPPHQLEKADAWGGFALGHDRSRIAVAALTVLTSAVPFAGLIGATAQSYQSREQLRGRPAPGVRESFGFAARRARASIAVPLCLTAATAVPLVALVILSLVMKVPYAGPMASGLVYGVQIALGAATLFLLVATALSCALGPVIVAFEETSFRGTMLVLVDLARRPAVRIVTWGLAPTLAFLAYALAVFLIAALSVAIPLAVNYLVIGAEALAPGPGQVDGLGIGLVPIALWIALVVVAAAGVVASVGNAMVSILYLAGRTGNDDLSGREAAHTTPVESASVPAT